jgi:hypothetical protein
MANQKTIVAASEAAGVPAPSAAPVEAVPATLTRFWKGTGLHQEIKFKDGTAMRFGREAFVTADEKLVAKIRAVAHEYGILAG